MNACPPLHRKDTIVCVRLVDTGECIEELRDLQKVPIASIDDKTIRCL